MRINFKILSFLSLVLCWSGYASDQISDEVKQQKKGKITVLLGKLGEVGEGSREHQEYLIDLVVAIHMCCASQDPELQSLGQQHISYLKPYENNHRVAIELAGVYALNPVSYEQSLNALLVPISQQIHYWEADDILTKIANDPNTPLELVAKVLVTQHQFLGRYEKYKKKFLGLFNKILDFFHQQETLGPINKSFVQQLKAPLEDVYIRLESAPSYLKPLPDYAAAYAMGNFYLEMEGMDLLGDQGLAARKCFLKAFQGDNLPAVEKIAHHWPAFFETRFDFYEFFLSHLNKLSAVKKFFLKDNHLPSIPENEWQFISQCVLAKENIKHLDTILLDDKNRSFQHREYLLMQGFSLADTFKINSFSENYFLCENLSSEELKGLSSKYLPATELHLFLEEYVFDKNKLELRLAEEYSQEFNKLNLNTIITTKREVNVNYSIGITREKLINQLRETAQGNQATIDSLKIQNVQNYTITSSENLYDYGRIFAAVETYLDLFKGKGESLIVKAAEGGYAQAVKHLIDTVIIGGLKSHNEESARYKWLIHPEGNVVTLNKDETADADYHEDGFDPALETKMPELFKKKGKFKKVSFEHVFLDKNYKEAFKTWVSLLKVGGVFEYSGLWQYFDYDPDIEIKNGYPHKAIKINNGVGVKDTWLWVPITGLSVPLTHTYGISRSSYASQIAAMEGNSKEISLYNYQQFLEPTSLILEMNNFFGEMGLRNIRLFIDKRFVDPTIPLFSFRIIGEKN